MKPVDPFNGKEINVCCVGDLLVLCVSQGLSFIVTEKPTDFQILQLYTIAIANNYKSKDMKKIKWVQSSVLFSNDVTNCSIDSFDETSFKTLLEMIYDAGDKSKRFGYDFVRSSKVF